MAEQGAPADRVAAQAEFLVACLPVGLQEEVADQVADDEDGEDVDPAHCRRSAAELMPGGYATRRPLGRLDKPARGTLYPKSRELSANRIRFPI